MGAVTFSPGVDYPNREELPFAARSFVGALPVTWIVFALAILVVVVLTTGGGPFVFLAAWILLAIGIVAVVVIGFRAIPKRTPTSIRIGSGQLMAVWKGSDEREVAIPFERITSVEAKNWRWTAGKGGYAHFIPASVQYDPDAQDPAGAMGPGSGTETVYLTDQNAERVRVALRSWSAAQPSESLGAIPSASEAARRRWRSKSGWSECVRCGGTLDTEVERETGICRNCMVLPS